MLHPHTLLHYNWLLRISQDFSIPLLPWRSSQVGAQCGPEAGTWLPLGEPCVWGGAQESRLPRPFPCAQAFWAVFWPWTNPSLSLKWEVEEGTLLESVLPSAPQVRAEGSLMGCWGPGGQQALWEFKELRLIQGRERSVQQADLLPLPHYPTRPLFPRSALSVDAQAGQRAEGRGQQERASWAWGSLIIHEHTVQAESLLLVGEPQSSPWRRGWGSQLTSAPLFPLQVLTQ